MLQIKQLGKSKLVLHLEKRYYHWQWMYVYVPTEHKSAPNMSREDSSLFRKKMGNNNSKYNRHPVIYSDEKSPCVTCHTAPSFSISIQVIDKECVMVKL